GRIVTLTRLAVSDVWHGVAPRALIVRQWGGELDGEVQAVAGDAVLPEAVSMVLFLRVADAGQFTLTALSQSVFVMDVVPPELDLANLSVGDAVDDAMTSVGAPLISGGWARTLDDVLGVGETLPHREVWAVDDLRAAVNRSAAARDGLPAVDLPAGSDAGAIQRGAHE
ncbi:MAG: hypothetical protein ACI82G_003355, partial [Bradymonadia bacterium]